MLDLNKINNQLINRKFNSIWNFLHPTNIAEAPADDDRLLLINADNPDLVEYVNFSTIVSNPGNTEQIQDIVAGLIKDGSGLDWTYNDIANTLTGNIDLGDLDHATLDNLNSTNYYHLTQTNHTDLTDTGNSALHYHSTDRARANHTDTQLALTISDFTEAAQDAVGGCLVDSVTVNFTYDDGANTITADVINASKIKVSSNDTTPDYLEEKFVVSHGTNISNPLELTTLQEGADEDRQLQFDAGWVNHNSLLNWVSNKHIDHSLVSIATSATSGLSGGGTIVETRNLLLDFAQLTNETVLVDADEFAYYDSGVGMRALTYLALKNALNLDLITWGTDNQIPVMNAGGTDFEYSNNLVFTATGLGIGIASPTNLLHLYSSTAEASIRIQGNYSDAVLYLSKKVYSDHAMVTFGTSGSLIWGIGTRDTEDFILRDYTNSVNVLTLTQGNVNIQLIGSDAALNIASYWSNVPGQLRLFEPANNGTSYIGLRAPMSLAASTSYVFPAAFPGTNYFVLASTTTGILSWVDNGQLGMSNPMTAVGDIIYASVAGTPATPARLPIGAQNQVLRVSASLIPEWGSASSGTPAGSDTQVQYNASGSFGAEAAFTYAYNGSDRLILSSNIAGAKIGLQVVNTNTGTATSNAIHIGNSAGTDSLQLKINSAEFTNCGNYAYIWQKQNAPLIFGTYDTEQLRITADGNVGIGTASPTGEGGSDKVLHINGSNVATELKLTNTATGGTASDGLMLQIGSGGGAYLWQYENNIMQFATNNSARMTILGGGNVGIGTTNPVRKLDLVGGAMRINYASPSGNIFQVDDNVNYGLVVTDALKVGIGTASPDCSLDIVYSPGTISAQLYEVFKIGLKTTSSNVNAGPAMDFSYEDASATENIIGRIGFHRSGDDNIGMYETWVENAGTLERKMFINDSGVTAIGCDNTSSYYFSGGDWHALFVLGNTNWTSLQRSVVQLIGSGYNTGIELARIDFHNINSSVTHNRIAQIIVSNVTYGSGQSIMQFKTHSGSDFNNGILIGDGVSLYYSTSKKLETISTGITVTGHILPAITDTYDIGSSSKYWQDLYIRRLYVDDTSAYINYVSNNLQFTDSVTGTKTLAQLAASGHNRQHSIIDIDDHISSATSGRMLKANTNGLPVNATNTDTEVADAVSKKHQQNTDTALGSGCVAANHGTASTDMVVNVCYGTGNPPSAGEVTEGALFIRYTA